MLNTVLAFTEYTLDHATISLELQVFKEIQEVSDLEAVFT